MENLKLELEKAIMERFKNSKIASGLEKELAERTEELVLEKYKGTKIKRGTHHFELLGVKCENETEEYNATMRDVNTTLVYCNISELNKEQKAELKKLKERWDRDKYVGWYDEKKLKAKLFIEESYDLDFECISKNTINLSIEGIVKSEMRFVR